MSSITFRSEKGSQLTSAEVDANFQFLLEQTGNGGVVSHGEYSIDGLTITLFPIWIWKIYGIQYQKNSIFNHTAAATAIGNVRVDIICGNQSNDFVVLSGPSGLAEVEPPIPNGLTRILKYVVDGDKIELIPPISGAEFIKKMGYRNLYLTGAGAIAPVLNEEKRNTVIMSYTGSNIIDGFKDGMPGQPSTLYQGMIVTIDNQTGQEVPLNDMTSSTNPNSDIKMDFRAGISQYTMKPGEVLEFKLRGSVLVLVSSNKAEVDIEVPTKTSDLTNDGADGTSTYVEHNELAPVATSNDYNDLDNLPSLDFVPTSDIGEANGVAPIGSDKKIPLSFLPDAILGQVLFGGTVVPATGVATLSTNAKTKLGTTDATITLTNDTTPITGYEANEGIYYIAFADGTFAGITLNVGDWLISTGSNWSKIDNTDAVTMVNGKTGAVTLNSEDIPYNNTTSELNAENAQDAFDELENKKLDKVTTTGEERVYSVNLDGSQGTIPLIESSVYDLEIVTALQEGVGKIFTISVPGKSMKKGQEYVDVLNGVVYKAFENDQVYKIEL